MRPRDWVDCKWCGGGSELSGSRGCVACAQARNDRRKELDAQYAREFPDGLKPILSGRRDDPAFMRDVASFLKGVEYGPRVE